MFIISKTNKSALAPRSLGVVGFTLIELLVVIVTRPSLKLRRASYRLRSAFTLIELLVVIVIIGILATLTTITLTAVRVNARDARRISDLKQIASALELYQADHSSYPGAITAGNALVSLDGAKTYMVKVPSDPSANKTYGYFQVRSNDYQLAANLEKDSAELSGGPVIMSAQGFVNNAGLIAWWPLNAGNLAKDISGNENNGSISGASLIAGRYSESGGAYGFDGDDYINLGDKNYSNIYGSAGVFSLSIWAYKPSGSSPYSISGNFFGKTDANTNREFYFRWTSSNTLEFNVQKFDNPGVHITANTTTAVATIGSWQNFVMTYDLTASPKIKMYSNGQPLTLTISDSTSFVGLTDGTSPLYIGRQGNGAYYAGSLADARIYSHALSQSEITALYNATRP